MTRRNNNTDYIMHYLSTRGQAPELSFTDTVLTGLAADGGLYVPRSWPKLSASDISGLAGKPYAELAEAVLKPFIAGDMPDAVLKGLLKQAYSNFRHKAVAPLIQIGANEWVMELFHGPTLAFKDFALQFLGYLLDYILQQRGETVTVIGATSGDTGSAAIEGLRHCRHARVFILHPKGRVSEVQRRQMTTVDAPHIHNLAVDGSFDDCQAIVKALFVDADYNARHKLAAVNSINWARIAAQVVYYFHAALALGGPGRTVQFAVPTGNFGDVFAGYVAERMGLPIAALTVATNRNDILARFLASGTYSAAPVVPTIAPSMDIQVSSNFERLLFDAYDQDAAAINGLMQSFKEQGRFTVPGPQLQRIRSLFNGVQIQEEDIEATIRTVYQESGMLLDPHTAIGVEAGRRCRRDTDIPLVTLATAHPAKFPDAVEKASGIRPALPEHLADLYERKERIIEVTNDINAVKQVIDAHEK